VPIDLSHPDSNGDFNHESRQHPSDKDLVQREKTELIAIIKQMLQHQPELEWLLQTPVPTSSQRTKPVNPQIYRDQITAILSLADNPRKRK
jgi:hypothetical protein